MYSWPIGPQRGSIIISPYAHNIHHSIYEYDDRSIDFPLCNSEYYVTVVAYQNHISFFRMFHLFSNRFDQVNCMGWTVCRAPSSPPFDFHPIIDRRCGLIYWTRHVIIQWLRLLYGWHQQIQLFSDHHKMSYLCRLCTLHYRGPSTYCTLHGRLAFTKMVLPPVALNIVGYKPTYKRTVCSGRKLIHANKLSRNVSILA
jgi:hypothetical protein